MVTTKLTVIQSTSIKIMIGRKLNSAVRNASETLECNEGNG